MDFKQHSERVRHMLKDITLGQYYPGTSPVHKLDPRTKILITIALLLALFTVSKWYGFIPILIFLICTIKISKVPFLFVIKGLKAIAVLVIITGLFNVFLTDGKVLFQFWFLTATYEGLNAAGFMVARISLLIVVTSMLTLTTTPIMLTDGIETLLSPLKKVKVPVHEFAMMMTIALRFIPTIMEETDKIIKAQSARGADFESGNILRKAKAMVPILVPLFISAFRRADDLAIAMECRCYHGDHNRTKLKQLHFSLSDLLSLFIILITFALQFIIEGISL